MSIEEIADNSNPKKNPGNGGSHVWVSRYVSNDLSSKTFRIDGLDLNNHLGKLKRLRTDADYGHDDIDEDSLDNAKGLSQKVQTILNRRYLNE